VQWGGGGYCTHAEKQTRPRPVIALCAMSCCTGGPCHWTAGHGAVLWHNAVLKCVQYVNCWRHRQQYALWRGVLCRWGPVIRRPATLQCAGNRRSEMCAVKLVEGRAPWNHGESLYRIHLC
jgi:hypothetical protein